MIIFYLLCCLGVIRYRNKNVQAEVAFAMSEEQHPDIAVLNVKENLNCSLKLADFEKNNYEVHNNSYNRINMYYSLNIYIYTSH